MVLGVEREKQGGSREVERKSGALALRGCGGGRSLAARNLPTQNSKQFKICRARSVTRACVFLEPLRRQAQHPRRLEVPTAR